jgi:hypothetical protein
VTLTQKLAAMSDRQFKHAYAIGDYWNVCEEAEARIRELEAALQLIGNELSLHADQGPAGEAFRALLVPTLETFAESPPTPLEAAFAKEPERSIVNEATLRVGTVEPLCTTCGRLIGDAYPECNNAFHAFAGNRMAAKGGSTLEKPSRTLTVPGEYE